LLLNGKALGTRADMPTIKSLERELRDLINEPRRHRALFTNEHVFDQLCSSLDVIGDTELALDAYLLPPEVERSAGKCYLRTYGVLQALILQQDAVQHLGEALGAQAEFPEELRKIREVRNDAVGHPTRRGSAPGKAFNHIARISLSSFGFQMMTLLPGGSTEISQINVPDLIATQRRIIEAILQRFLQHEQKLESTHRQQFRDRPLSSAFPVWFEHTFEKIANAVNGSDMFLGLPMLATLEAALQKFEEMLTERGELPAIADVVEHDSLPAVHAVQRLRRFFQEPPTGETVADAEAFLYRLEHAVEQLRKLATEIDRTYSTDLSSERNGA
jgi:hypothetical protein